MLLLVGFGCKQCTAKVIDDGGLMKRFSYKFDRHIAQAMYGAYCLSVGLMLFFAVNATANIVRVKYGTVAEILALCVMAAGAVLLLDGGVRMIPMQRVRNAFVTPFFVAVARWRHVLYAVGLFCSFFLCATALSSDMPVLVFFHSAFSFFGIVLMVRDGCVDNFGMRKRGGNE